MEKGLALSATLVGVLASSVALVDWAGGLGGHPPPRIDARIERVKQRDTAQPLRDYLAETKQSPEGYTNAQLNQRGYVFNVAVRIIGQQGKSFPIRFALYRRDPEARVAGRAYNQIAGDMKPESADHASTWPVWVPYPAEKGQYFVRFTLEDQRSRPVSEVDSQRVTYPP